jgi:hypothetical protein
MGFGPAESVLLVVAVINIHHFIVDAYIWKLRPGDSNRQVVVASRAAAAPAVSLQAQWSPGTASSGATQSYA